MVILDGSSSSSGNRSHRWSVLISSRCSRSYVVGRYIVGSSAVVVVTTSSNSSELWLEAIPLS